MAETPKRRLTRELHATVTEVVRESRDAVTLVLRTPEPLRDYRAGQFVNVDPQQFPALAPLVLHLQHIKGRKEHSRAYSLTSAPHEDTLAITVKVEPYDPTRDPYPPLLSPYLVHAIHVGDSIRMTGFMGPYVLPDELEGAHHVLHVVAGSGAVPNLSILKDALHRKLPLRHTFIASNKTAADVLFKVELQRLERQHPDQLRVIDLLTREADTFPYDARRRRGRISRELLQEVLGDPQTCLAYVCGPAITSWERRAALEKGEQATPRFLESTIGFLQELGMPAKKIKRESYG